MNRNEFLKLTGSSVIMMLMSPSGLTATLAEESNPIKIGLHPYYNADPAKPSMQRGFNVFATQVGKRPYFYSAWTDPARQHTTTIRDWTQNVDVLSVARNLKTRITLNMEIEPDWTQPEPWFSTFIDGKGTTEAGINADNYIMNIAIQLKKWVDETGHTVPVRMFHEWNKGSWGGSEVMPVLWRRHHAILTGGDVNAKLAAMGQEPLATSKSVGVNNNLRFIWSPLMRDDEELTIAQMDSFWPGDRYVDQIGPDIYPHSNSTELAQQFENLERTNQYALDKGLYICFPEFHWSAGEYTAGRGTDSPEPMRQLFEWMIDHKERITFASVFEAWKNYSLFRVGSNPHPELKSLYKTYLSKTAFTGA